MTRHVVAPSPALAATLSLHLAGCVDGTAATQGNALTTVAETTTTAVLPVEVYDVSDWIAYQGGSPEGVWLIHPNGTGDHQIMTDLSVLLPDWSPVGRRLMVSATPQKGDLTWTLCTRCTGSVRLSLDPPIDSVLCGWDRRGKCLPTWDNDAVKGSQRPRKRRHFQ